MKPEQEQETEFTSASIRPSTAKKIRVLSAELDEPQYEVIDKAVILYEKQSKMEAKKCQKKFK